MLPKALTFVRAFICTAAVLTATSATAQSRNCADRALVVERLATGYGEQRQSVGIGANNTMVEVFASLKTGTWTITITQAGGLTCLVASGLAFEAVSDPLPNTDSGA